MPSNEALELRQKWDRIYRATDAADIPPPARVLAENAHLLPRAGTALDLASGLGGNALFLARRGLETRAYDISWEALARLERLAERLSLGVATEVRDVVANPPEPESFDAIIVSRFLHRSLAPAIQAALRPGGLLFYQTYTVEKARDTGPSNPAYLLQPNELLGLFRRLRLLAYREEGWTGETSLGFRNEALLVGQKT